MIYSVRGILVHKEPTFAVVECGGVGYKCFISFSTYNNLVNLGEEIGLLTHMNVREDSVDLYGFLGSDELNVFKVLTTVSGVGAKVGLAILSEMTPDQVAYAVIGADAKAFTRCSGVGPKLASRIVLELKDKYKGVNLSEMSDRTGISGGGGAVAMGAESEAIAALMALGYTQGEAASVVAKMDKALTSQEMIKLGLKELAKRF